MKWSAFASSARPGGPPPRLRAADGGRRVDTALAMWSGRPRPGGSAAAGCFAVYSAKDQGKTSPRDELHVTSATERATLNTAFESAAVQRGWGYHSAARAVGSGAMLWVISVTSFGARVISVCPQLHAHRLRERPGAKRRS